MNDSELRTDRLILRPIEPRDADAIHRHIADWDIVSMLAMPPWPYTREHAEAYAANAQARGIEFGGELVGAIGLGERDGRRTIGYWIGKAHWGRGLMSEAIRAVVADHFADDANGDLHSAFVDGNLASWRVQEKVGFEIIGDGEILIVSRAAKVKEIRTRLTRARHQETVAARSASSSP